MAKRGRPTDNKKAIRMNLRLTTQDAQDIALCADFLKISKTAVITKAVECLKKHLWGSNY